MKLTTTFNINRIKSYRSHRVKGSIYFIFSFGRTHWMGTTRVARGTKFVLPGSTWKKAKEVQDVTRAGVSPLTEVPAACPPHPAPSKPPRPNPSLPPPTHTRSRARTCHSFAPGLKVGSIPTLPSHQKLGTTVSFQPFQLVVRISSGLSQKHLL